MRQITSAQFKVTVELDPGWASKLAEPVEITDYCNMEATEITHLSPLLHFTGKDKDGNSVSFNFCKSLKIAEGKFPGFADFCWSGIEKIGNLSCGKNNKGTSANFWGCKSLKVAEGKFEGFVDFDRSSIETIGDLTCGKNNAGIRLNVENCSKLTKIPVTFNPKEVEASSELLEKLEVDRFIQKKRAEIVEIVV